MYIALDDILSFNDELRAKKEEVCEMMPPSPTLNSSHSEDDVLISESEFDFVI